MKTKDKYPADTVFGVCQACKLSLPLTKGGNVTRHYGYFLAKKSDLPCRGSNILPERVKRKGTPVAPKASPRIVISGKAQLFAQVRGIDLAGIFALDNAYKNAKATEGLARVTYDRLWAENALNLATHGSYTTANHSEA